MILTFWLTGLDSRKEVPFMSTLNVPGVVSTDGDNQDTKSINEDTVSRRSYFFEQQEGINGRQSMLLIRISAYSFCLL